MYPDKLGHFEEFGGRYVPETLMPALEELAEKYDELSREESFQKELNYYLQDYAGRPTPLYYAKALTEMVGGPKIFLKREDLTHTGAHKINNTLGQALLARRMGKQRVIAETGAGQHGVATATAAAMFGLKCEVYMGEEDMERQSLNVFRMNLLGARVIPVTSGSMTLKDATNEAIRDWVTHVEDTYYIIGSVVGPHPYPRMVRDFQSVIGLEAREQFIKAEGNLPGCLVACVGGGSNAIGLFFPFIEDTGVDMVGVEAAGLGLNTDMHAATLTKGRPGVLHGSKSYLLQDSYGQISPVHSISAGLDYPGVGPEHAFLKTRGRAEYQSVTDGEALEAFRILSQIEGIIPALESAHAIAYVLKNKDHLKKYNSMIICLSGRGDKDVNTAARAMENMSKVQGYKEVTK